MGEMMGEPKHPEDLHEIAERDIAAAHLKILVGGTRKVGAAGHFRLRPVPLETMLPQPLAKHAHGVRTALDMLSTDR